MARPEREDTPIPETGDAGGGGFLSDERYGSIIAQVGAAARDVALLADTRTEQADKAFKALDDALTRAFNVKGTRGHTEGATRSVTTTEESLDREDGRLRREELVKHIGLGTLAAEVLCVHTKEVQRIRQSRLSRGTQSTHAPPLPSLKRLWKRVPVLLRHVVLPVHALARAIDPMLQLKAGEKDGGKDERLQHLLQAALVNADELKNSFITGTTVELLLPLCVGIHMMTVIRRIGCLGYNAAYLVSQATSLLVSELHELLGSIDSVRDLDDFLDNTTLPLIKARLLVGLCDKHALRSIEAANALTDNCFLPASRAIFDHRNLRRIDVNLARLIQEVQRPPLGFDRLWYYPRWTDSVTLERFLKGQASAALPVATQNIIVLLCAVLFIRLLKNSDTLNDLVHADGHNCYHTMSDNPQQCRNAGRLGSTYVVGMSLRALIPRQIQFQHPLPEDCQAILRLLQNFYGCSGEASDTPYTCEQDDSTLGGDDATQQRAADKQSAWLAVLNRPPFQSNTTLILACIVALGGVGLHKDEAELAMALQKAWNQQTLRHPHDFEPYPPINRYEDIKAEYDCEDRKTRRLRRDMVSALLSERIALAEAKAVAAAEGQQEWDYDPVFDHWVSPSKKEQKTPPPNAKAKDKAKSKTSCPPSRPSSPDPLIKTSPFGPPAYKTRRKDEDEDEDEAGPSAEEAVDESSDADSIVSNLRLAGTGARAASSTRTRTAIAMASSSSSTAQLSNPYAPILADRATLAQPGPSSQRRAPSFDTDPNRDNAEDDDDDAGDGVEDDDDLDLFQRRTPMSKRRRRPPKRYSSTEESARSRRRT